MIEADVIEADSILIYGASVTGRSFIRIAELLGKKYVVCDDNEQALQQCQQELHCPIIRPDQVQYSHYDLILTSPGVNPRTKIFHAGIPVWGDWELAWHCNISGILGPQKTICAITGTNGKTTTAMMTHAIFLAAGRKALLCGNIGIPVLDALLDNPQTEILVAELSSFQLHYAPSLIPDAGVLLNVDPDHIDWHGSLEAYLDAKMRVLSGPIAIIGRDDPIAATCVGANRTIGITLDQPNPNELGISYDGFVVDRAFTSECAPEKLMAASDIVPHTPAGIIDALAAIALARSQGVTSDPIYHALSTFVSAQHRGQIVCVNNNVTYIDNSKATNPHAAISAINDVYAQFPDSKIIWIVGGQLKGADILRLVEFAALKVSTIITFGVDSHVIVETFLQHAPNIPIFWLIPEDDKKQFTEKHDLIRAQHNHDGPHKELADNAAQLVIQRVTGTWDGTHVMSTAVQIADRIAHETDIVLLAPAAASLDMFTGYGQRGELFAQAARQVNGGADHTK